MDRGGAVKTVGGGQIGCFVRVELSEVADVLDVERKEKDKC